MSIQSQVPAETDAAVLRACGHGDAAALGLLFDRYHHVVRGFLARASGTFYLGPPPLPSVLGVDGIGRLADGRRVFVDAAVAPFGTGAQHALVRPERF